MYKQLLVLALLVVYVSSMVERGQRTSRVVYNGDTRQDEYQVLPPDQALGSGVVVILDNAAASLQLVGSNYNLVSFDTAENTWGLCPAEPFSQELIINAGGYCSGFLICTNPALVATARHCVTGGANGQVVIFDFNQLDGATTKTVYPQNDVYFVTGVWTQGAGAGFDTDYGVFELDRAVIGRTPYTTVNANPVVNMPLNLIGHPIGFPKKYDLDGVLTTVGPVIGGFVDSYGGNSGSPVFDDSGALVGILVGGAQDFVDAGGCDVSNECPGGPTCDSFGESICPICTMAYDPALSFLFFATICSGGIGGDPHVFTFGGQEINLTFGDGKNYLFYYSPEFRVVVHASGPQRASYITAVGIAMGEHHLLAVSNNGDPTFFLDGEEIGETATATPIGDIVRFNVEDHQLAGALAQLQRYLTVGIKVDNMFEIVGGIHPGVGVFFNVQVKHNQMLGADFEGGILKAASGNRERDQDLLSNYEVDSLFA